MHTCLRLEATVIQYEFYAFCYLFLFQCFDWPQSLCNVCPISSNRRLHCLCFTRSNCSCVGLCWYVFGIFLSFINFLCFVQDLYIPVTCCIITSRFVFDIGLRKKFVSPGAKVQEDSHQPKTPGQMDLFGQADAVVKHVLEVSLELYPNFDFQLILLYLHCILSPLIS